MRRATVCLLAACGVALVHSLDDVSDHATSLLEPESMARITGRKNHAHKGGKNHAHKGGKNYPHVLVTSIGGVGTTSMIEELNAAGVSTNSWGDNDGVKHRPYWYLEAHFAAKLATYSHVLYLHADPVEATASFFKRGFARLQASKTSGTLCSARAAAEAAAADAKLFPASASNYKKFHVCHLEGKSLASIGAYAEAGPDDEPFKLQAHFESARAAAYSRNYTSKKFAFLHMEEKTKNLPGLARFLEHPESALKANLVPWGDTRASELQAEAELIEEGLLSSLNGTALTKKGGTEGLTPEKYEEKVLERAKMIRSKGFTAQLLELSSDCPAQFHARVAAKFTKLNGETRPLGALNCPRGC